MKAIQKWTGPLALIVVLALVVMQVWPAPAVEPGTGVDVTARSYECAVYTEQGCAKMVVASGGEIEVQSGGTLDIQAGATTDFSSGIDLDGAAMTIDADADTILDESADDVVGLTMGAAAGTFSILTGNFKVGNGAPTTAQDGEDAYVESVLEVAGQTYLLGGVDVNGTAITLDADADSILDESADDVIGLTIGAAAGTFSVLTGNFKVGNGAPTTAQDGEDLYVESLFEVDGTARFDGVVDINNSMTIDGGLTDIGAGTYATANGDNDLGIAGDLEVDGVTDLDGTLSVAGATTLASDITISADSTGGNAGAKTELAGLVRIKAVAFGAGTDATAAGKTLQLMDDTPAGEWAAHDADTTVTASAVNYRVGSNSLSILFSADADAGDGAHDGVAGVDFTDDESVGFWVYSAWPVAAGDLQFDMTDDGGNHVVALPAITANIWQWIELDISGIANADKDVISDLSIELTAQGAAAVATAPFTLFVDGAWKWDATEERALSTAILQDGVLMAWGGAVAAGSANTPSLLVENTDFFVHYESGADFLVTITDQSANYAMVMVAY